MSYRPYRPDPESDIYRLVGRVEDGRLIFEEIGTDTPDVRAHAREVVEQHYLKFGRPTTFEVETW